MSKHTPLTNDEGEVRELSAADLKRFKPAHEVLPASLQKTLGMKQRGPQKSPTPVKGSGWEILRRNQNGMSSPSSVVGAACSGGGAAAARPTGLKLPTIGPFSPASRRSLVRLTAANPV